MSLPKAVAVFGASGHTGRAVVATALTRGLRVRALYRPGSQPNQRPSGLEAVTGQLIAHEDVERVLTGVDGAILVFGPRLGGPFSKPPAPPGPFCAAATESIVTGMKRLGIQRLVCQTGAMAGEGIGSWSGFVRRFARRYRRQYPEVAADRDHQERVVETSGLDWVLVKPFRISRARSVGNVLAAPAVHISAFTSIPREDLARFLVDEATGGRFHQQAVYAVKG